MAPKDKERDEVAREIEGDKYREILLGLQKEHTFLREFGTWGDVVAFMREGASEDPLKDEVLRPILMAHAADGDPRWRTILIVVFWPGLKSICIRRRGWEGMIIPHLACDTCGQPIERLGDAIVQVFRDGRIRVVHKSMNGRACDDRCNDGGWIPLAVFLWHLLQGLGFDTDKARKEAETWGEMGQ